MAMSIYDDPGVDLDTVRGSDEEDARSQDPAGSFDDSTEFQDDSTEFQDPSFCRFIH